MVDAVNANTVWRHYLAPPMLVIFLVALVLMRRRQSSVLGLWLLVVLWAWFIETALLSTTSARFSLAWYAGKIFGLLSSSFVLLALLAEATMLHAQLAISVAAEKRENESRRMTMEVIVAGIAHELQQPLSAIVANSAAEASMLARTPPDWEELRAAIDDISRDGCRAIEIIESIRSMFATGSRDLTPINVNELVEEALAILRIKLQTNDISVTVESSSVPPVHGHKGQLIQVLSNLITNAIESMSEITDRTRLLRIHTMVEGSEVSVFIEDSGTGIDRKTAERIFEPFFTTKGKGMGLGLAICKSIVESHRGHLSVVPGTRFGSVFRIELPVEAAKNPSGVGEVRALVS
jgi:signal transduction histidine kinase